MTRQLAFTSDALADLDQIFLFIARDDPRRARTYVGEIQDACAKLRDMPHLGMERPDLRPGVRVFALWEANCRRL